MLDDSPALPPRLLNLLRWAADYYHHPLGECWQQALPVLLRKGEDTAATQRAWRLTTAGLALPENALKRAPQQQAVLTLLLREQTLADSHLPALGLKRETLRALAARGLAEPIEIAATAATAPLPASSASTLTPTDEQHVAINTVAESFGRFQCHLLDGVTGSGKTEVYLTASPIAWRAANRRWCWCRKSA